jgi:AraC-like DNA-binding protein
VLNNKYLSLKTIRLKPKEEWVYGESGISFVFPRGGIGNYIAPAGNQRLGPGDVLILKKDSGVKLSVSTGNELIFWQFSVAFENLFPLFSTSEIPLLQNVTEGLKDPVIHSGNKPLAKDCHRLLADVSSEFDLLHRSQLLRVVVTILSEEFKRARGERVGYVRAEDHLMQVFEKMPVDDLLTLSVGELADRFGCSRRHLSRLFQQHFGFSVAALRMEMRLLKAVSLLRDPDAKIIHVAQESGFNHLGLFNSCFKKRFGTSPGQWRKLMQQSGNAGNVHEESRSCPLRANGLCPWTGTPETAAAIAPMQEGAKGKVRSPAKAKLDYAGTTVAPPKEQAGPGVRFDVRPRST